MYVCTPVVYECCVNALPPNVICPVSLTPCPHSLGYPVAPVLQSTASNCFYLPVEAKVKLMVQPKIKVA